MRLPLMLCALLCAPLFAGEVKLNEKAPPFVVGGRVVNPYEFETKNADCLGSIVVVMEWNYRDLNSAKAAKKLHEYWPKWGGKGLLAFAVHRLKDTTRQVELACKAKGYQFCVPMGGFYDQDNEFDAYHHSDNVWRVCVINPEGIVVFYGKAGFETILEVELKKMVYPGLGKQELDLKVQKAGHFYSEREFGQAIKDAQTVIASKPPANVEADAQLIIDKATAYGKKWIGRATTWITDKRYDLALPWLETLAKEFKGHEIGDQAKATYDRIDKDRELKPEFKAFEALKKLVADTEPQGDDKLIAALKKFAQDNAALRAGGVAADLAKKVDKDRTKPDG